LDFHSNVSHPLANIGIVHEAFDSGGTPAALGAWRLRSYSN
jgi:hypothetical protein